jgi:tRNA nucleotidyltransferase/poly(A) polymerase
MTEYNIYIVGGYVRDNLLGILSNDIDFCFVINSKTHISVEDGYKLMKEYLINEGFKIYQENEKTVTLKAKFPENNKKYDFITKQFNKNIYGDFVLSRKEIYNNNSRIPLVELGTLEDDLLRRDFTINAMALDSSHNLIDLFNGQEDLKNKILRTPIDPNITMYEDPLRIIRALRFHITKNMIFSEELEQIFSNNILIDRIFTIVSIERIREELLKMFKFSTIKSIKILNIIKSETFLDKLFNIIWLKPTTEKI